MTKIENLEFLETMSEEIIKNNLKILSLIKKIKALMTLVELVKKEIKGKSDTALVEKNIAVK